mmetsp:Transcript_16967/g.17028  ORF Transcript_16967/g.17028 Transcript_16967/m.17028 type:complete len:392 (+) Transcript_16967:250-1425(+)
MTDQRRDWRAQSRLSDLDTTILTKGTIPEDGVYFRAPGVSRSLRSFPVGGPVNCHQDSFKNVDAFSKKVPTRLRVPIECRRWEVPYDDYEPESYIAESVLRNCRNRNPDGYADPEPGIDVMDPRYTKLFKPFNPIWLRGLSRNHLGLYLHPYGRVGITGQGVLGNRQINEAIDPVTTYLDETTGEVYVLLIKRIARSTKDTTWAVPGGMVDFKPENNSYTLPRALNKVYESMTRRITQEEHDSDSSLKENALRELKEETGFNSHVTYQKLIAQMYCDDSRTTDTTWIGTTVFLLVPLECQDVKPDGVETAQALWVPFKEALTYEFYASHRSIVTTAVRYYVTNSFRDRGISGSEEHCQAYEYLQSVMELDLPQNFESVVKVGCGNGSCVLS